MKCVHGVFFNRYCRQCDLGDDKDEVSESSSNALLNAKVKFGLRAQGHMHTVASMLADHKPWKEIGEAIGWDAGTAKEYWLREISGI